MQQAGPELTKPGWWPAGMIHWEPDHLLKSVTHGVNVDKLQRASLDLRRHTTPTIRLQVLDEIYFVRQMEERFLDGEIDASFLLQMTQTLLPEDAHDIHQAHVSPPSVPAISVPPLDADNDCIVDALARKVGVRGIFSDWLATVTYYANCMGFN
ncbi:hypothetical protein N7505_001352 [Penicillium chrysogenum]|uniref:Subtelomeric hrmA-associated cluster protein AFUB-079030/YDR124W-like helical bundle domain-containing protein n=1 Tax=Penicillium chrysogenum TaxID=5076 RepID=A0ABQ8WXB7_PENCH|nr:hypothetical protein N7505_001352 [Penicillium chrysogenum]